MSKLFPGAPSGVVKKVDGVWISPCCNAPMRTKIDPALGELRDCTKCKKLWI